MNSNPSYYEILECSPCATFEELKRNYQKLVKQAHPDKLTTTERVSTTSQNFLLIDEAWKVLRDSQQRKIYDSRTVQLEVQHCANSVIYAEITSDSLNFENAVAYYQCRCGKQLEIHENTVRQAEKGQDVLFECSDCSNNILVTIS